ncbi:Tht1-domain-containing protein, partial [Metschnikowia bicuspidata var. bicuspidata NRRL YB-4993]
MSKSPVVLALQTIILLQGVSVVLGNDLSLFASEIGSQFKDLYQSQQLLCSQNALYEFINECQLRGADSVSPKLRIQLAVKLSICEFKEANVEYPKSCQNVECDEDFEICVQEFLESPQLWTTYSGHYRRLRSVCYEEAVPFIRHNILDLFFNVT